MKEPLHDRLGVSLERLAEFCHRWQIIELDLFGSILREDFRPDSDVDLLVEFAPDVKWSLLDHIQMELELKALFARPVDLVSKRAIERSGNWIRRQEILDLAQPIYVS